MNALEFLKLKRAGHNPEEFVEAALTQVKQEQDEQLRGVTDALIEQQHSFEKEFGSLIDRVAALDVTQEGMKHLSVLKECVKKQQVFQIQQQEILSKKQTELVEQQQNAATLKQNLASLSKNLREVPDPFEEALIEAGSRISQRIGNV